MAFEPENRAAAKITPERHRVIIEALESGHWISTAARLVGLTARTIRRWVLAGNSADALPEEKAFAEAFASAAAKAEVSALARATPAGDAKAAQWFLERRFKKRWGKVEQVELTGRRGKELNTGTVNISRLGLADITAIFAATRKAIEPTEASFELGEATPDERGDPPESTGNGEGDPQTGDAGP